MCLFINRAPVKNFRVSTSECLCECARVPSYLSAHFLLLLLYLDFAAAAFAAALPPAFAGGIRICSFTSPRHRNVQAKWWNTFATRMGAWHGLRWQSLLHRSQQQENDMGWSQRQVIFTNCLWYFGYQNHFLVISKWSCYDLSKHILCLSIPKSAKWPSALEVVTVTKRRSSLIQWLSI